jgi:hypothetical protein
MKTCKEKYQSIKRTLSEIDYLKLILCQSDGIKIPYGESTERQKYDIELCSGGRCLLLDADIVKQALKENLGRIKDSIRYLAQSALYQTKKDALEEAEFDLESMKKEVGELK